MFIINNYDIKLDIFSKGLLIKQKYIYILYFKIK